jgi:hypothetical protein
MKVTGGIRMKQNVLVGLLITANLMWVAGCSSIVHGKDSDSKIHIEKDQASQLDISLNVGAGQLNVSDGANDWVDGEIIYNIEDLKPKVDYKRSGNKGIITIEQSKRNLSGMKIGNFKNEWNLQLSNKVPIELEINTGAAQANLDLQGLLLDELTVNAGVGDVIVDLGGDWQNSFEVDLKMGVGKSTVILPSDIGVRIHMTKGIGKADFTGFIAKGNGVYVNEAYDDADVKMDVNTELGIGNVNFVIDK